MGLWNGTGVNKLKIKGCEKYLVTHNLSNFVVTNTCVYRSKNLDILKSETVKSIDYSNLYQLLIDKNVDDIWILFL
jgi:hypothetical protein